MSNYESIRWIVEIKAPENPANYAGYYAKIETLFEFTKCLSIISKRNLKLDISGYDSNLRFCEYLLDKNAQLEILFHITCFDLNKKNLINKIEKLKQLQNVRHLLVITGDDYKQLDKELDFLNSDELIEVIMARFDGEFESIAVAAYPGGNQKDSHNNLDECQRLKRKILAGINTVYTQCLFDVSQFHDFCSEIKRNYLNLKIVPSVALFDGPKELEKIQQFVGSPSVIHFTQKFGPQMDSLKARELLVELCERLRHIIADHSNNSTRPTIDLCTFGQLDLAYYIMKTVGSPHNIGPKGRVVLGM